MKSQHKTMMITLYKGKMPKAIRKQFCQPDRERAIMDYDVKKPSGYTGI